MTRAFVEAVEQLTRRRVVAYHSQVVFDPDVAFEFFVLEPDDGVATGQDGVDDPAALGPGEAGDADGFRHRRAPKVEGGRHTRAAARPELRSRTRSCACCASITARARAGRDTFFADDYVFCIAEGAAHDRRAHAGGG